jgi:hypothetical protein
MYDSGSFYLNTMKLLKAGARVCKSGALMFLLLGPKNYQICLYKIKCNFALNDHHQKLMSSIFIIDEEESRERRKTFQEISQLGYGHIHTLKVVPSDGKRESINIIDIPVI